MNDIDKELKRIEKGEAWDESDEVVQVEVKRPLDKVVPVRLPTAEWEKLRKEARELGVGPTTLARMWILERLRLQSSLQRDVFRFIPSFVPSDFPVNLTSLLTPIEMEINKYIYEGYNFTQITERLGISESDVISYLKAMIQKLGTRQDIGTYTKSKHET